MNSFVATARPLFVAESLWLSARGPKFEARPQRGIAAKFLDTAGKLEAFCKGHAKPHSASQELYEDLGTQRFRTELN